MLVSKKPRDLSVPFAKLALKEPLRSTFVEKYSYKFYRVLFDGYWLVVEDYENGEVQLSAKVKDEFKMDLSKLSEKGYPENFKGYLEYMGITL